VYEEVMQEFAPFILSRRFKDGQPDTS